MATTCEIVEVTTSSTCNDRGGIRALYVIENSQIDWAGMVGDPAYFDAANQEIIALKFTTGANAKKWTFERKEAFYEFTYTAEQDFYNLLITLAFKGKDRARRNALTSAIACCDVTVVIFGNGGEQRIVGIDYNGTTFDPILELLRVTRHVDAGGQLGSSRGRDELDFGGESFTAPLFGALTEADLLVAGTVMSTPAATAKPAKANK